ncbi:MAG TPA: ATP-dependent RNA helicase HrpA [Capillimicrobium sp.]|nr:ATP-dependent RNA helicase HrpA [Capillimicrobium sp.]
MSATADLRSRLGELTLRDEHRLTRRLDALRRLDDADARGEALTSFAAEVERAEARIGARRAAVPAIAYPPELPVSEHRGELLAAIRDHQVVVVAGETGSGKTTQLPKICLELGRGVRGAIAHTQPRRLAARTVAERIADELGVGLGETVGYAVRFDDRSSRDTLVRLMTDGLLLAEIQHDRLLRRYDTIIVDEAHERSLNIDFLLGYLHQILPKRPDLKLVITSATIDPQRFAEHFGDAPVVEVSGRTYPVEVRYQPLSAEPSSGEDPEDDADGPVEDRDPTEAIGDAVEELLAERRGDVLVFLSGEREIRDTADALGGRLGDGVEILPLYARLATSEQQRVWQRGDRPRVVLATNVAETSLTVPGIRSVVDPGTARISRYSARLKVQRLPIERISQASADQRKGRCGRVAEGVCIRLYSEEDFESRPRFTDPEILRTSLAAVILQMAAIGLGDIERFPFLDPPDRRQVRDGVNLLVELGALDASGSLTPLGRRLAALPVDPRMARMVLEADRLGCADEVIVIAAALSIQDPRERPVEQRAQADQLHARFADDASDFMAYLNLWRYLREQRAERSGNQFRKLCKAEYLHYLRVREWQDLVGQLRGAAKSIGITINREPAEPREIHQALLAGLLSHVGLRDERAKGRADYVGARGARFAIFPGSRLARRPPDWVMVAELVETSRLWGRVAARVDPAWVEPLAEHLVKRSYSEPRWQKGRGSVVATERVTLYGLPIVAGRTVPYGRIDPALSRELFIRRALVEGDWDGRHAFLRDNAALLEEVEALEHRARRRDILVDDEARFRFFDERIPEQAISAAHFDRWWRDERRRRPDLLTFTRADVVNPDALASLSGPGRPEIWKQGDLELRLSYVFDPGSAADGVTVHVPLRVLPRLRPIGFDWLVPAFRLELVTALLRGLPKELRTRLVPVPETAAEVLARLRPRTEPLVDALARELEEVRGVTVRREAFDVTKLPTHLRMTFSVEDDGGRVVASGLDLERLRAEVRPRLQAELTAASASVERSGERSWRFGALPRVVALPGTGDAVRAYPALVDEGDSVGVRAFDDEAQQAAAMWAGTRRLLLLTVPPVAKWVQGRLATTEQLALAAAPHGSVRAVIDDATVAAVDALMAGGGAPAWDEAGFKRLREHVAGSLAETTLAIARDVARILGLWREVDRQLDLLVAPQVQEARLDMARQVGGLLFNGFVAATGASRLGDVERYLRGVLKRIERLPSNVAGDLDRQRAINALEESWRRRLESTPGGYAGLPAEVREVPWLLQELRVAQLAPAVGAKGQVSAKRIRRLVEA